MKMTFDQYIQNPMGTANAVMSNREMYRKMYMEKLDKIMVRENGKTKYKLYRGHHKYYAHIKVPSETLENFYYDVIIEFSKPDDMSASNNLRKYNVRFFSNDPSFVYTFAHAFIENDLFIKDLTDKMSKEAVKKKAVIKNPQNQVGYVKTLYFAYLIMIRNDLFNKLKYLEKYNAHIIKADIEDADKKISDRVNGTNKPKKKSSVSKARDIIPSKNITLTKNIKNISTTKKTNTVKTTKRTINTVKTTKRR